MNRRTRLIVSLLFAVVILMAVAITRSYVSLPKNPSESGNGDNLDKILYSEGGGFSVFSDGTGLFGIAEGSHISAAPEWASLSFAGNDRCIASRKIGGILKFGCIDFDGNVVVPFIYSSIERKTAGSEVFYYAVSESDGSCVLYDSGFVPCLYKAWKSCRIVNDEITFSDDSGDFIYSTSPEGLLFRRADLKGRILDRPYNLSIYSRLLLSKLDSGMIEKMADITEEYIKYAFGGDSQNLKEKTGDVKDFSILFADSEEITEKKLVSVPEIHIYSVGKEDGVSLYDVVVTAETEITYIGTTGETEKFTSAQRASVRFMGDSETKLEALGGSFEADAPEYPEKEIPAEEIQTEYPAYVPETEQNEDFNQNYDFQFDINI